MSFDDLIAAADRAVQAALGGVSVTYAPTVGSPVVVTGMFDEQYVLAKGSAEAAVSATVPAVFLRLEDLPTNPEDEDEEVLRVTIRAIVYRVTECKPDGMGGIVLALRRVS